MKPNFASQQDKLEKFGKWRIDPSRIEFSGDVREFRGGFASVSQAVLVVPSNVQGRDSDFVEGENREAQGEEGKHEEKKPSTGDFARKVGR